MRLAVVGAGICGLSAARFLSERGHAVTLFEQLELFHTRGSSHGRSRIVRRAYPDPFYTSYMVQAYPLWAELQAQSDLPILFEPGLLYIQHRDAEDFRTTIEGLDACDVPYKVFDQDSVAEVMPSMRLKPDELGIFTPEAGWVQAENALMATAELARAHGTEIVTNHKANLQSQIRNPRSEISHQESTISLQSFDSFVVCAGAWIREFANVDVHAEKHTVAYFQGQLDGPVWIDGSNKMPYGFPSEPGTSTFKIGVHGAGLMVDPDLDDRQPGMEALETASNAARERFGVEPVVKESLGCLYTSTASEDFRLGRIGTHGFYASACSGHGFKFGPWIGKLLADFVEGRDSPERYERFCVHR